MRKVEPTYYGLVPNSNNNFLVMNIQALLVHQSHLYWKNELKYMKWASGATCHIVVPLTFSST